MNMQKDLQEWLEPFLALLPSGTRRAVCSLYVASLLNLEGEAGILPALGSRQEKYNRLRHFVTSGVWDHLTLCDELARQANALMAVRDSVLVVGDVFLWGENSHAVGSISRATGDLKQKNIFQQFVSLTLVGGETIIPVGLRLVLPGEWLGDTARLDKAEVPDSYRRLLSKADIALQEIDRLLALGLRFGTVVVTGGGDRLPAFCKALNACGLAWIADTSDQGTFWAAAPSITDSHPQAAVHALAREDEGSPQTLPNESRDAPVLYRVTRGFLASQPFEPHGGTMDGIGVASEALQIELRDKAGRTKDYLASSSAKLTAELLQAVPQIVARNERALRDLRKEFHFDEFDGRTWQSLHRHMLMAMIAFIFSRYRPKPSEKACC